MSQQVTDPFIWEDEEWIFLGADDVYTLFDPEKYGLSPTAPHTACWKGFIVQFRIANKQLFLDKLEVHCDNGFYPPINGVEAIAGGLDRTYNGVNLKLPYSGTIIVGRTMKPEFYGRAFTGPHSYETTYELILKDGEMIESKETSGQYFGF